MLQIREIQHILFFFLCLIRLLKRQGQIHQDAHRFCGFFQGFGHFLRSLGKVSGFDVFDQVFRLISQAFYQLLFGL